MGEEEKKESKWRKIQSRLFTMVSVGVVDDKLNTSYDIISISALLLNLIGAILMTFDSINKSYGGWLFIIEKVTIFFFAIDYILRILTADLLYPRDKVIPSIRKYIFSFSGIVDLLSFLPYYLPVFFPAGAAVFRMFRVVRILRLFRINAYYDSLNVITEVLKCKKQQLLSSVFIILILMVASSLCMYSVEHTEQPEVFANAFSGIWWSASTLLTVGYGDIYPITILGKMLGIAIAFLGVGMVAIPTGIISAGFVEQYSSLKELDGFSDEKMINFVQVKINYKDEWAGKKIGEIILPKAMTITGILRDGQFIVPKQNVILRNDDNILIGAEGSLEGHNMSVKQINVSADHKWNKKKLNELDLSRKSYVATIIRNKDFIEPKADLILKTDDKVVIYSKEIFDV